MMTLESTMKEGAPETSSSHDANSAEAEDDAEKINLTNPPFPLTPTDLTLLQTRDADFTRITWRAVQAIIARNRLEDLTRLPSDLRRYLWWSHRTREEYGSVTGFVVRERLGWEVLAPRKGGGDDDGQPRFAYDSPTPFASPSDYAVLLNDWPYGFDDGIVHLVAWSKAPIPVDESTGDVTVASRRTIEDFVRRYFVADLERDDDAEDRVLWFKNWTSLQSVRGVDHVHILARDVPSHVLAKWTVRRD